MLKLDEVLGPKGLIARRLRDYEARPQQLAMARAVDEAIRQEHHLVVEAGTGVGKSFAYLVPAILAATDPLRPRKVIVSTHTITLQEQLVHKDIPFLQATLPTEFTAVLAKGRSNYLSKRRLDIAYRERSQLLNSPVEHEHIERIYDWARETADGSLSELPFSPLPSVWNELKSEADNCMGTSCPRYEECFFFAARRRIHHAQLIVVNHSLYFVDLVLRQAGASILPDHSVVIFDEAHTLEDVASRHLGVEITSGQLEYNLKRLYNPHTERGIVTLVAALRLGLARNQAELGRLCEKLARAISDAIPETKQFFDGLVQWASANAALNRRLRNPPPVAFSAATTLRNVSRVASRIADVISATGETRENQPKASSKRRHKHASNSSHHSTQGIAQELSALADRLRTLVEGITSWLEQRKEDLVYWIEVDSSKMDRVSLYAAPIDVGAYLKESLYESVATCVLTSATLAVGRGDFAFLRRQLGLEDGIPCRTLQLGSPFRYEEQAEVHIVEDMPDPTDSPAYEVALAEAIRHYVQQTRGDALVLFTSHRTMLDVAERVRKPLESLGLPLLVQGQSGPRSRILEAFRQTRHSVLFGTDSFWQGVDVPGDALRNVIITRLPFRVPDHPLLEARLEYLRVQGKNPFLEYQVPQAILRFKQGFGRLIRTHTDRGLVVILDCRVLKRPYGRLFLESLPPCRRVISRLPRLRTGP